jgi:hypothetical protein
VVAAVVLMTILGVGAYSWSILHPPTPAGPDGPSYPSVYASIEGQCDFGFHWDSDLRLSICAEVGTFGLQSNPESFTLIVFVSGIGDVEREFDCNVPDGGIPVGISYCSGSVSLQGSWCGYQVQTSLILHDDEYPYTSPVRDIDAWASC